MYTHARRRPTPALVVSLLVAVPTHAALAQHPPVPPARSNAYYYTLPNTTGKTATDLHLTFNAVPRAGISNRFADQGFAGTVATFVSGTVPNGTQDNGVVSFGRRRGPFALNKAEWSFPDLPPLVPGGQPRPQPNIPIDLKKLGIDGYRTQGATTGTGYIVLSNMDVSPVFISSLQLAKDISDGLIDVNSTAGLDAIRANQLYLSSGTAVLPGSSSFTLSPGQVRMFNLGDVTDDGHVAALFQVATAGGEMATLGLLTNDVISSIPEPSTVALLAGGLLPLGAALRRRRDDAPGGTPA
jgi:hypothetical protein